MNPFQFLTRAFIDVFGITHPTPKQERTAGWFICTMLAMIVLGIVLMLVVVHGYSQQ